MKKDDPNSKAKTIDDLVGERLRARRSDCKVSQTQLGDALGVTFQQIQKYEKGTNRISPGRLYMAAQLLEVPIEFFFKPIEIKPSINSKSDRDKWLYLFDHLPKPITATLIDLGLAHILRSTKSFK